MKSKAPVELNHYSETQCRRFLKIAAAELAAEFELPQSCKVTHYIMCRRL